MKKKSLLFVLLMVMCLSMSITAYAASGSWKSDSNGWWYQYSNGSYATGWASIGGEYYYFDNSGYMASSEYRDGYWINGNGTWNANYSNAHWDHDDIGWWYTDSSGWYPVSQWLKIDGSYYYFKSNGYLATDEYIDGSYVGTDGAWIKDYTPATNNDESSASADNSAQTDATNNGSDNSSNSVPSTPSSGSTGGSSSVSGSTTVYVSNNGKMHKKSNCSGMKNYTTMTYDEAVSKGKSKCHKCF